MRGGTLFSGIGAPELAAPEIAWRWCAEIDPFACAVLAERFPHIRNLGDVTQIDPSAIEPVDVVVFGSPCQSFSVAGKRQGLGDARGGLAFVALGIVGRIRPRWVVFENVPGLLSSGGGRDFGAILGALAKCGYGLAYRILDAQFFGVPQRRRRVFVVGHLGDWRPAAAVLFERDSLRRDPPPRREPGERVAPTIEASAGRSRGAGTPIGMLAFGGNRQSGPPLEVATAVRAHPSPHGDFDSETFIVPLLEIGTRNSGSADEAACGLGIGEPGDPMYALQRGKQHGVIAFDTTQITHPENRSRPAPGRACHPLAAAAHPPVVVGPMAANNGSRRKHGHGFGQQDWETGYVVAEPVTANGYTYTHEGKAFRLRNCVGPRPRRLTPRECERLQGLPDDWTAIEYRGKPAADGPRYRAIGNSMAVPAVAWLLQRLRRVHRLNRSR